MDGIYSPQDELQRQQHQQQHQQQQQQQMMQAQNDAQNQMNINNQQMNAHRQAMANSMMAGSNGMQQGQGSGNNGSLDSLDDIIQSNQRELYRRRSMPQSQSYNNGNMNPSQGQQHMQQQQQQQQQPQSPRRMSFMGNNEMMTFGSGDDALGNYPFNQQMANNLQPLATGMPMTDNMGNYMGDMNDYPNMSPDLMGSMIPSTFANMNMGSMGNMAAMGNDGAGNGAYSSSNGTSSMNTPYANNQVNNMNQMTSMGNDFTMTSTPEDTSMQSGLSGSNENMLKESSEELMEQAMKNFHPQEALQNGAGHNATRTPVTQPNQNQSQQQPLSRQLSPSNSMVSPPRGNSATSGQQPSSSSDATTPATGPSGNFTSKMKDEKDKTIYSKSGFDMLKALWLVATRRDPKIHLGAVDMSCAFVVCDVSMNDCPIVYVSDNFQNLTGYSRHDIIGQNCRFLQAPDGAVEAGSKREFVDDGAVYNLKKMVHERREVQQSLINYRKGGKPFLNLLTMIPIPWDTDEIRYFIGFQIDLVECPDAISGQELGGVKVDYKHSDIGQYIWTPPQSSHWDPENGQTLGMDDVSTLLQQFQPKAAVSDWHKQSWDKMLLENTDDVVHVLSLKGLFLYASPACKQVLEYDSSDLVGNSLSSVCHPSDIVPVTRELKDTTTTNPVNIVFRIRRKHSGYTWFESHGSLFVEQGKGRKCIVLVGRKRPVFTLSRRNLELNGGIGDSELWTKLSTSGMFLYVSSNIRSLLDLQPESLVGTSIQELMRKDSKLDFGRAIEKARRGKTVTCKHEVQNRRGQVLQAQTVLYPGDASEGEKPSFLLGQTKLLKASSRSLAPASAAGSTKSHDKNSKRGGTGQMSAAGGGGLPLGSQDAALASDDNMFDELRTTKCSSWQFELRQMEKVNRILAEELGGLLSSKKKRKRRKGVGNVARDCANCHTKNTPEWRRGPSGQRDLCNSCGLRWAKQTGRVSPRNSSRGGTATVDGHGSKKSASPISSSPLHKEVSTSGTTNPLSLPNDGNSTPNNISNPSPNHVSGMASSGAASATGQKAGLMMPPLSQPSIHNASQGNGMTSIREERENSQA